MEDHIATADDFRRLAEARAWEPERRIILPESGLAIVVRRPRPLAYVLVGGPLPQSLAASIASDPDASSMGPEERAEIARRSSQVLLAAVVRPKFSLNPSPDEVSPAWLSEADQQFLFRYIFGEVDELGNELAGFHAAPA